MQDKIRKVCEELLPFYQNHTDLDGLLDVAKVAVREAEKNYESLLDPKTCDLNTYILRWASEAILSDIQLNQEWVRDLEKRNKNFKEAMERHVALQGIYAKMKLDFKAVPKIWKEIDSRIMRESEMEIDNDYKQLLSKLAPAYAYDVKALNDRAREMGFDSQVELSLNFSRIPKENYQFFLNNRDKVIKYCQQLLPDVKLPDWFYSKFNGQYSHDFLSLLSQFPQISFPDGVINFVADEHPILNKFRSKLKIDLVDGGGSMKYLKKTDSFWIGVDKNDDHRHQVVSLIHELGHVVGTLENFQAGYDTKQKGLDISEYEAFSREYSLLKKLSPDIYKAEMANVLLTLSELLFQIESFMDPNQDLAKVYAQIFNHCFPDAHQTSNPTYLIKFNMLFRPLRHLPHAIAQVKAITEIIDSDKNNHG